MSALARKNGWRGFDGIGEQVEGGWEFRCDGMPSLFGCPASITVQRRWRKTGVRNLGWVVCYGTNDPGDPGDDGEGHDVDVVLTYCPSCAAVVKSQREARP